MNRRETITVAVPWSLSHYIQLNGFHPVYRALFDHVPETVTLCAWDNVKLYRRFDSDLKIRESFVARVKEEKRRTDRLDHNCVERVYREYLGPSNTVLTDELPGNIEFHHTAPFPSLNRPFVLHCEAFASVLFPFSHQGSGRFECSEGVQEHYRRILANPLCLGIFSHVPETLDAFRCFFENPHIDRKLFHLRIGLSEKVIFNSDLPEKPSLERPRFLFINVLTKNTSDFFRCNGHIALRFWKEFLSDGRDGTLILSCAKPSESELAEFGVDVSFVKAQTGCNIIWTQDYLSNHEMNALIANAHFFLLPDAALQSVSIMQAMTLGTVPVMTDSLTTSLYGRDGQHGIVVQGPRASIWHGEGVDGVLMGSIDRAPNLDDFLVEQLTSRICRLVDKPSEYWKMRRRTLSHAREQFSGQAFSTDFWGAVSDLYEEYEQSVSRMSSSPNRGGSLFRECTIAPDGWARSFESPPQGMVKINTGKDLVCELGGAMIHVHGNSYVESNDWSVMASYYSETAPPMIFANTLEQLEGKYFPLVEGAGKTVSRKLIRWVSKILRPVPTLYLSASRVLSIFRRYVGPLISRFKGNRGIELVRQGVKGYNIVRYGNRYYAILQSERDFFPAKAEVGDYSSCFSDYSVDQVLRYIATNASLPIGGDPGADGPRKAELILK